MLHNAIVTPHKGQILLHSPSSLPTLPTLSLFPYLPSSLHPPLPLIPTSSPSSFLSSLHPPLPRSSPPYILLSLPTSSPPFLLSPSLSLLIFKFLMYRFFWDALYKLKIRLR